MNTFVENLPQLETSLAPLNREAMQTLLLDLARRRPELAAEIALEAIKLQTLSAFQAIPAAGTPSQAPLRVAVDPSVIRRQVRTVMKSIISGNDDDYWDDDDSDRVMELENGIAPLMEVADAFTEVGDGHGALPILEAITAELVDEWDLVEDVISDAGELFSDLGRAWAEALLTAELNPEEREIWTDRLETWRDAGQSIGAGSGLETAVEAVRLGWDYPPLVRVLEGEITAQGAWEDDDIPDCADALATARLNVLERQGRWQEAAYLAEAEGQSERHLTLLVRLGRAQEAVDLGREILTTAAGAFTLAKALHEHGEIDPAFRMAEHGLNLPGLHYSLAIWLRDAALTAGETERAIRSAKLALQESPQLQDYTHLEQFAGELWSPLKAEILDSLRALRHFDIAGKVDIFLYEGLMEEALHAVHGSWNYDLVARVVEAATPTHPLQVLPVCKAQAATIMDAGKADRYHHAAKWVERARNAYRVADQESEWQAYKAELLATHRRKYKLIPMLRGL